MDYKKKIEYAEKITLELQNNISKEKIMDNLKLEGLYEMDITSIMVSATKILGEKYSQRIREFLRADKAIEQSQEFISLDKEILYGLIKEEKQKLALEERKKITKMIKEGHSGEAILNEIDNRFLSHEKASEQLSKLEQVNQQNSGSGRILSILGGIALIVLAIVILFATGRLFYFLPIIGIVMIVKGFLTERMSYED